MNIEIGAPVVLIFLISPGIAKALIEFLRLKFDSRKRKK